jgi:hypothetical protein
MGVRGARGCARLLLLLLLLLRQQRAPRNHPLQLMQLR